MKIDNITKGGMFHSYTVTIPEVEYGATLTMNKVANYTNVHLEVDGNIEKDIGSYDFIYKYDGFKDSGIEELLADIMVAIDKGEVNDVAIYINVKAPSDITTTWERTDFESPGIGTVKAEGVPSMILRFVSASRDNVGVTVSGIDIDDTVICESDTMDHIMFKFLTEQMAKNVSEGVYYEDKYDVVRLLSSKLNNIPGMDVLLTNKVFMEMLTQCNSIANSKYGYSVADNNIHNADAVVYINTVPPKEEPEDHEQMETIEDCDFIDSSPVEEEPSFNYPGVCQKYNKKKRR